MNGNKLDEMKQEIRKKLHDAVKELVQITLDKIHTLEKQKNTLQSDIKILKHDLFDLKDGRIDRILERQDMDARILGISLLQVVRIEGESSKNPWYIEYLVKYSNGKEIKINNSVAKTNAPGSYKMGDGTIKYL